MDKDDIVALNNLKKTVECLVCNKIPTNLLISNCEHIFCDNCVNTILKRRISKCPKCKKRLTRKAFSENEVVSNLITLLINYENKSKPADEIDKQHVTDTENKNNLVVNQNDIEKYMKENLGNCQIQDQNCSQNPDNIIDEFISISQVPKSVPIKTHISPIKLQTKNIKADDKVISWLNCHATDFLKSSSSKLEKTIDSSPDEIRISFDEVKCYEGPKSKTKNKEILKAKQNKENVSNTKSIEEIDTLGKLDMKCSIKLSDCLQNQYFASTRDNADNSNNKTQLTNDIIESSILNTYNNDKITMNVAEDINNEMNSEAGHSGLSKHLNGYQLKSSSPIIEDICNKNIGIQKTISMLDLSSSKDNVDENKQEYNKKSRSLSGTYTKLLSFNEKNIGSKKMAGMEYSDDKLVKLTTNCNEICQEKDLSIQHAGKSEQIINNNSVSSIYSCKIQSTGIKNKNSHNENVNFQIGKYISTDGYKDDSSVKSGNNLKYNTRNKIIIHEDILLKDSNNIVGAHSPNKDKDSNVSSELFSGDEPDIFQYKEPKTSFNQQSCNLVKAKERKTFSLEANTEDLQNINNDILEENTQEALTLIFNERHIFKSKLVTDIKSNDRVVCKFIKPFNLFKRKIKKHFNPVHQPVLFLLKGQLDKPLLLNKSVAIQCSIKENSYNKSSKDIQTQTSYNEIPHEDNCVSETETDENYSDNSREITIVQNINYCINNNSSIQDNPLPEYIENQTNTLKRKSDVLPCIEGDDRLLKKRLSNEIQETYQQYYQSNDIEGRSQNQNVFDGKNNKEILKKKYDLLITHEDDDIHKLNESLFKSNSRSDSEKDESEILKCSKRKRHESDTNLHNEFYVFKKGEENKQTSVSFKRKRNEEYLDNISLSSDSDIDSCLRPVKSVQLSVISDEEIGLDENMTIKFTSIHDSENSDTNIIKKHKVQPIISSGNSSTKENVLQEDSEPLTMDKINPLLADIDAEIIDFREIDPPENVLVTSFKKQESTTSTPKPNKPLNKSNRTPMKQISNLCSTPADRFSKTEGNTSIEKKAWDTPLNTLDKTSDLDKIIGAIERDFMEKELDTQNREEIFSEVQHDTTRINSQNETKRIINQSLYRSSLREQISHPPSRRSLVYQENTTNTSPQILKSGAKDTLNESTSTIVDYPKENTEPFTSTLNKTNVEQMDMEISSSIERQQSTTNQTVKNTEDLIQQTEKSMNSKEDTEIDYIPSSMEVRPLCLACSCLLEDDIVLAKNFANKFNIKFVMKYEESVTHLIVRVNKENCAERSLKFINAVVSGIWVLNKKWIIESLAAQKLLPEYKYEVLDISLEPGPKRNRLTSPSSLFNNIKVFIIGPFHSTSNDEFKALLRKSGVLVQNNFIAAQMIVVDDGEQTKDEIEEIYKKYLKPVVDMGWFLDCICRGRLVKMVDHLLMPELSELNVKNYPSQLFQDTERI